MKKIKFSKSSKIRAALDIGSSKIVCAVGKKDQEGGFFLLGYESRITKSIKKGIVVDPVKVGEEINYVINEVSKKTQTEISNVVINANVTNSKSNFLKGKLNLDGEKIDEFHIKSAINNSNLYKSDKDFESLHELITDFDVDDQKKIIDPKGLFANQLSANIYQVQIRKNYLKSLEDILLKLNLNIEEIVASPFASSLSTLIDDEKELGTICIDLGFGVTSVCLIESNKLIFTDSVPVGANNITYDLASGLSTSIESAERLKTLYGSVFSNPSDEHELIDISTIGNTDKQFNQTNISTVNSYIKPRVEETLELVRQKLKEYNLNPKQYRRVVLTGGGALLEGIGEYAKIIFDSQARVAYPIFKGLDEGIKKPQFSTVIGLLLYSEDFGAIKDFSSQKSQKNQEKGIFSKFSSWLDNYI
ncbi:MAG: Cell division protein FtsA [Alphaproteobacteria bacterium MarineAlpha5_Bin11]|nr:cell division protein FtsA [Pelagibacteraceae bacterium]PPR43893.1 MAG: Cell division protein FtsA [Alphaproteobacteria bacterium MarineAlpha5_Bin11]PPR51632.1 MAG: Cell division protein FtsA [Alphaproteobacteria bacterium MarineAlpha5_Bin10]|tara:strand:- start:10444 stop:11697 length:1254 start_codon:yes stop_codon:yes gene_type:complete